MSSKSPIPFAPANSILKAKALTIRIQLLESSFRACDLSDESEIYLHLLELASAYKELMAINEPTKQLILLSKVS